MVSYSATYAAAYMGAFCAINPAECPKEPARLGMGVQYAQVQEGKTQTLGGYLSMNVGITSTEGKRVRFSVGGLAGAGNSDSKNFKANHTSVKNELALFWELYPRLGINIATKKYPLYLNIDLIGEGYSSKINRENGYTNALFSAGIGLEGIIPTTNRFAIEYGASYNYIFAGYYWFGQTGDDKQSTMSGYSYGAKAHIGFSYAASEKYSYYLRFVGKYQDLSASKPISANGGTSLNYPATTNIIGMLEMGFGFMSVRF
ncbi:hypothetical protein [Helicobacter sp. MIT 01-3238]|uniref:hypothetical protein n=1 Tax=Helicobacter sp. MIT 01-3238 TaxID=398627 RepID=UPI000E1EFAC2|nr:hypothetical protein [Helicobacter sp. MIT 01-3238]RDU53411.1 hypothetical protein CQA40_05520 [Helicobacter sp. MIT 01-3238]